MTTPDIGASSSRVILPRNIGAARPLGNLAFAAGLLLAAAKVGAQSPRTLDRVIVNGTVMDPASGLNAVRNIGLRDGRIAAITRAPLNGRDTIDARGLVVAPGFIDIHAHGQTAETYRFQSLDGVTSSFELELGTADVAAWYRARAAGQRINYGVSIGHIKVRMAVLHDSGTVMPTGPAAYRAATPDEIREIDRRIQQGLNEGALSVGAGFTYTPAATHEELLSVFRVAAANHTPVHVHIRTGVVGLTEAIALAREAHASLHVVHINSAGLAETPAMLKMIADARAAGMDVSTEAYPYTAGMTEIQSATIQDRYRTAPDSEFADIEWPRTGERLTRESFAKYSKVGGPVVIHTNTEAMAAAAINSPLTIIGSDAYWQDGTGHPRTTGTFSRVLGRYARGAHSITLMEALRKMTLMPAQRLEARVPAMRKKGRLALDADADITIFDAATVIDRSTYREPSLPPIGIQFVLVNGVPVVANGKAVEGVAPGRAVRAPIHH
jgi:N-acyl-D-aspartate/D-glutamate deacylase